MDCEPENAVDQIKDGIWIGGIRALIDRDVMCNMDAVISVLERDRIPEQCFPLCIGDRPSLRVFIADGDVDLVLHLERISRFIGEHRSPDTNILIHCMGGKSRSVISLAYYLVTRGGYPSLDSALKKIKSRRPSARPKPETVAATKKYLAETWFTTSPERKLSSPQPRRHRS
jgi:protein-tyrosine phosphatase